MRVKIFVKLKLTKNANREGAKGSVTAQDAACGVFQGG